MIPEKWILTSEDFENARILYEEGKISPLNQENMFSAGIYCILSAAENYQKHKRVYNELIRNKLDTPENIKKDEKGLIKIIRRTMFPNTKFQHIYKFSL